MPKFITKFSTTAAYEAAEATLATPYVSLTEDNNQVHYAPKITPQGYNVMDYLFSDGTVSHELVQGKTPVAICVIPTSHMTDGKARFMSLKAMTTGSTQGTITHAYMRWQSDNSFVDIQGLTNYDTVATINSDGTFKDLQDKAYLPVDSKEGFTTVYNGNNYHSNAVASAKYAPSPFLSDGSKNEVYFTSGQALCDIDGNANTTAILNADANKYLAAKACRDFAPGTHNGEWYLPAMGELGYVMRQWHAIDAAIIAATAVEASCGVQLGSGYGYWSSTECSSSYARGLNTNSGYVLLNGKDYDGYVRAFVAF